MKRHNQNKSVLSEKYFPRIVWLDQNNMNKRFLYSLAEIKNRYETVRALAPC